MKENHRNQIKILLEKVDQAIESTMTSDQFKAWLSTMAKFHKYSFNNQLLILAQKPEATRVAGYRAWQKNFNRQVVKGAKSIAIFGHPQTARKELERDDGEPEILEWTWYPIVRVFDISDTKGDPLPDLDRTHVQDNSPEARSNYDNLKQQILRSKIKIEEVEQINRLGQASKALGVFSPKENLIQIATGFGASWGELFKTLAHEVGHALYESLFTRRHEGHSYAFEECVVETSAMIVASHAGLDLAPYDASYVAGWSKGDLDLYKNGLEKASNLAARIISEMKEN